MTTGLSDKQLDHAYYLAWSQGFNGDSAARANAAGLRAVADLAVTQAEAEIYGLRQEIDRLRLALKEAQAK